MRSPQPWWRLLASLVVAVLAILLGPGAAPSVAAVPLSTAVAYTYDSQTETAPSTLTTGERGPLSESRLSTPYDAIGRWSAGTSVQAPRPSTCATSAAAMFGDDVVEMGRIVKTPYGTTDIDIVLSSGTLIEVDGPAKAFNPAKFGQQLQRVRAADAEGEQALFMYEPGTPQSATELATKGFGQGGARPIE